MPPHSEDQERCIGVDGQRNDYAETEVAQVRLANRPGELARAATRLGEAGININYGYGGAEPENRLGFIRIVQHETDRALALLERELLIRENVDVWLVESLAELAKCSRPVF